MDLYLPVSREDFSMCGETQFGIRMRNNCRKSPFPKEKKSTRPLRSRGNSHPLHCQTFSARQSFQTTRPVLRRRVETFNPPKFMIELCNRGASKAPPILEITLCFDDAIARLRLFTKEVEHLLEQ